MTKDDINRLRTKLAGHDYLSVEATLDKMPPGAGRLLFEAELCKARALDLRFTTADQEKFTKRALRCLVECFLSRQSASFSAEEKSLLLESLSWAAARTDPVLRDFIAGSFSRLNQTGWDHLVRAFYFEGATLNREPPGKRALMFQEDLKQEMWARKTIGASEYSIEFLKRFASYTPLLKNADPSRLGGGYFASFGGYGCIIDPGHHFLDNFFTANRSLFDVDAVIVTHFHDDHYADLPALFSLLHQRTRIAPKTNVDLFFDCQTYQMFEPFIRFSQFGGRRIQLRPETNDPIEVTNGVLLRTLPTWHSIFGKNTGVGLTFDILPKRSRLIITSDTAWNDTLEKLYRELRSPQCALVAHVSTVCREEVFGVLFDEKPGFYAKHLGIRGLCRAIETVRPSHVILSEVGEELGGTIERLATLVERLYPCKCTIAWPDFPCRFPVDQKDWV